MMNRERRKELARIADELSALLEQIEAVKAAEEEAYENLPESIRDGDRGTAMQEAIDAIGDAGIMVEDAVTRLNEAAGEQS